MSAAAKPLVSVIITSYNYERYVGAAVRSVLDQSYREREVIVIDDGSGDDSLSILRAFGDAITLISQPNRGKSVALNQGIAIARGQYLAFLDSDDIWPPDSLAQRVAALEVAPDVGVVYGRAQVIDAEGHTLPYFHGAPDRYPGETARSLLTGVHVPFLTVMVRRDTLECAGAYFDPAFGAVNDWELYLRLARVCHFIYLDDVVGCYRLHGANWSRNASAMVAETSRFVYGLLAQNNLPQGSDRRIVLRNMHTTVGIGLLKDRPRRLAWHHFARACAVAPNPVWAAVRAAYIYTGGYLVLHPTGARTIQGIARLKERVNDRAARRAEHLKGVSNVGGIVYKLDNTVARARASLADVSRRAAPDSPLISVVVVTYNDGECISACLESVVAWADELVVLDLQSTDDTVACCRAAGAVVYEHVHVPYVEAVRQEAIALALGRYILVLDPDERATPALGATLQQIAQEGVVDVALLPWWLMSFGVRRSDDSAVADALPRFFRAGCLEWPRSIHTRPTISGLQTRRLDHHRGEYLIHDSWKTSTEIMDKIDRYTAREAREMYERGTRFGVGRMLWALARGTAGALGHRAHRDGTAGLFALGFGLCYQFVLWARLWELDAHSTVDDALVRRTGAVIALPLRVVVALRAVARRRSRPAQTRGTA